MELIDRALLGRPVSHSILFNRTSIRMEQYISCCLHLNSQDKWWVLNCYKNGGSNGSNVSSNLVIALPEKHQSVSEILNDSVLKAT
jgi:hypothetical protein